MPYQSTARQIGVKKKVKPMMSTQICPRLDRRLDTTSMRTCSLFSSV